VSPLRPPQGWVKWSGTVLAVTLVAACAAPIERPDVPPRVAWNQRSADLEALESWDMKGRMAVRTEERGGSASVIWSRDGERHGIDLYGPFGGGRVHIEEDPRGATLRDSKGRVFEARNAAELLYRRVGWAIPFDELRYWLRGLPAPGERERFDLDEHGRLALLHQDGWEVRYLDYDVHDGFELPRKVFMRALPGTVHLIGEEGEPLGDRLDVRVVIRSWDIAPGKPGLFMSNPGYYDG
jgi:outer membrane lipoprotein LolB